MRKLKLLFIALASTLLSGCSMFNMFENTKHTNVEVEAIVTTEPNVRTTINDSCMLQYNIYPSNATDKSITVDTADIDGIATVIVDDYNYVFVWGTTAGVGSLRLITSNGKSVRFNITVIDPNPVVPDPEEELSALDRLAKNYNEAAAEAGYEVYYYSSWHCWWLKQDFGHCAEPTKDTIGLAVHTISQYLPTYMFRYDERYDGTEYKLVMVNSNISVAADVCGFIENENLIVELTIYSVW